MKNKYNLDELIKAFSAILKSKEACKKALKNPAEVLIEYGVSVLDIELTNSTIFETAPSIKPHLLAVAAGKEHDDIMLGCSSPKCVACKVGLNAGLATVIAAAIETYPECIPAIEDIADFCGLSEKAVKIIIAGLAGGGTSAVETAISDLCDSKGAC